MYAYYHRNIVESRTKHAQIMLSSFSIIVILRANTTIGGDLRIATAQPEKAGTEAGHYIDYFYYMLISRLSLLSLRVIPFLITRAQATIFPLDITTRNAMITSSERRCYDGQIIE